MSARRRILAAVLLLWLTVLLAFLFNRTQATDIEAQNRVMLYLREFEKLDAEWNVNILRSHIGANPNYDPLSAPLPRMHELLDRLGRALPASHPEAARRTYAELTEALRTKEELVEQFKSHNAILRNSLAFLPGAIADLKTALTAGEGRAVPRDMRESLDSSLDRLLLDTLRYNMGPDPALAARIGQTIDSALAEEPRLAPRLQEELRTVAMHARAILRYRELQNNVENRIAAVGTATAADRLAYLLDRAYDQGEMQRQKFRSYLFVYSGVLLVLLMALAWRLRRSYRIIGQVNRDLQAANETLEKRVAERTSELEAQSAKLRQMALHDGLTGLINYAQFTRLLDHALVRAARRDTVVVVMFIDLDGFKAVNDTYGHATGDLVLKAVARRVQDKLRKEDALARLGGDEFAILLEEVASREGALRVAEQTLAQICSINEAGGHPVRISASIGVSATRGAEGAARGPDALLADADQAMYAAKQAGKNGIVVSTNARWEAGIGATAVAG
jgi:diguanylate cyclase (GGDEF)-like protein